jgi:hypothetical protein
MEVVMHTSVMDNHDCSNASNGVERIDGMHGLRSTTTGIVNHRGLASFEPEVFVDFDARIATGDDDETTFSRSSDLLADIA